MIVAIGTDILDARRIRAAIHRFGQRFVDRCFHPQEQAMAAQYRDPVPFYARRFAGKEAVAKALGTGIGANARLTEIIIGRTATGQPVVALEGAAQASLRRLTPSGTSQVMISLSDEDAMVVAFVVISAQPSRPSHPPAAHSLESP